MTDFDLASGQVECRGGPLDGAVAGVGCADDAGMFSFFVDGSGCGPMRVHTYRLCRDDGGYVYFDYFGVELVGVCDD